jgi:hypothetical protein
MLSRLYDASRNLLFVVSLESVEEYQVKIHGIKIEVIREFF